MKRKLQIMISISAASIVALSALTEETQHSQG
jgi:hypothetical protein